jgi:predicted esterase
MSKFFNIGLGLLLALSQNVYAFECLRDQRVAQGLNKKWITHQGVARKFYAEFPEVPADTPVGVIFSWHGVGGNIDKWRRTLPLATHSSSKFPFIVITPEDTGLTPLGSRKGMGWDLFKSLPGDDNLEAKLFESVLGCLFKTHTISMDRIYSAGFSGGAIVSNMLHARYPRLVAAVYAASGAWLNDSDQRDLIKIPLGLKIPMQWVPLRSEDQGAVLMTYGSEKDVFSLATFEILNFHDAGVLARWFLPQSGRTAVVCEHDGAHRQHPLIDADVAVKFFNAHPAGMPSPFETTSDLPRSWGSGCEVVTPGA